MEQARAENDVVVISLFVNPAQFAPNEDFDAYPRTWEADRKKIEALKMPAVAVFMPTQQEMYPRGITLDTRGQRGAFVEVLGLSEPVTRIDHMLLTNQLEGLTRPHFFRGVATVVTKLFNIVQPERAYFGQKDIQQTIVLRALVRDLHLHVDLRVCPTVREPDGLALSSRNAYLTWDQRDDALVLFKALRAGIHSYESQSSPIAKTVREAATEKLSQTIDASQGRVSLDYFSLVNSDNLQDLKDTDSAKGGVLVGAVFLHGASRTIRLIDNVILG